MAHRLSMTFLKRGDAPSVQSDKFIAIQRRKRAEPSQLVLIVAVEDESMVQTLQEGRNMTCETFSIGRNISRN
jgi:hypothetical protein